MREAAAGVLMLAWFVTGHVRGLITIDIDEADGAEREAVGKAWQSLIGFDPHRQDDFDAQIAAWLPLTHAVNSLNCSMSQPDLNPFIPAPTVMGKLRFVHGLIHRSGD